jgi:acyl-CoA synthetase (AMP-forming)/AMP-acid ligase II
MFDAQVELLREFYDIQPGEIDLPGFPLFALFNSAMGVTTVIPDMDPTRPAQVDPERIIETIRDQGVTQAFGSPAIWNRVGRYCEERGIALPSLRRVLSAGAPVPLHVIERMRKALPEGGDIHTPYGATESLPVASISGREVLEETVAASRRGAGTCVGRAFPGIRIRIIEVAEGAIAAIAGARELARGEIGEIIVQGPSTTREYFRRAEATAAAKIADGEGFWHRMGDVGYLDSQERLWFCGRKAHIVETAQGRMFSACEAIFDEHPRVYRSALVGVGAKPAQRPVIVVEPEAGEFPETSAAREQFERELRELARGNELTRRIETFLFQRALPVDVRHNVKIFREKLAPWAEEQLRC